MNNRNEEVPTVWLVNQGGHDYKKLDRFGNVVAITTGSVNPFNPGRLLVSIQQRLRLAKPSDYIAISGLPILNGLVMVFWLMRFEDLHLLQWSTRDGEYKPRDMSREQIERMVRDDDGCDSLS